MPSDKTPEEDSIQVDWDSASATFADAIEDYFERQGKQATAASVRSTIETNTRLVPKRAENLLLALGELTGIRSLEGLRVVEAGCGFGSLAAYLALAAKPSALEAIDVRADYVAAATASVASGGLGDRLVYRKDDMRTLDTVSDKSVDLVILNNSFIYLSTRAEMRQAVRSLGRVLRPAGHVLLFQANRWVPREPFTKDPLIHLLPASLARPTARLTGWRHNHGRVRLVAPPALKMLLTRRGFESVEYGAFGPDGFIRGKPAWCANFFALAGRRAS